MKRLYKGGVGAILILASLVVTINLPIENAKGTTVGGSIDTDTTWKLVDSPFFVIADITVESNVTLTIEPGVWIGFGGFFGIFVYGTLLAVGTEVDRIIFTYNNPTPNPGDWYYIKVFEDAHAEIKYADISYSTTGINLAARSSGNIVTNNNINSYSPNGLYLGSSAKYNYIANNNFIGGARGIYIESAYSNNIINNDISVALTGAYLGDASYNNISGNFFAGNGIAIHLQLAHYNNIDNNNVTGNGVGMKVIADSMHNNITHNEVYSSTTEGIYLDTVTNNNVRNNIASLSGMGGITLWKASNNDVVGNKVTNNNEGIYVGSTSSYNRIYHNNIIDNSVQANDDMNNNHWNDTYPSGGNYWSNWSPGCTDLFDGATTPQTGGGGPDGICDLQYDIDGNSADYYPLTTPIVMDEPPTIEAWEPGGTLGQTYTQGDTIIVTWTVNDDNPLPPTPINISYGYPGISWTTVATNEVDDGIYNWDTSAVLCPKSYYMKISVYDSKGQEMYDIGNYSFGLYCPEAPPTIEGWEPGGTSGQTYTQGDIIEVTWTASDGSPLPPNPINITYGNLSIGWTIISTDETNDGTYNWNTSLTPCPSTYWMNLSVYDSIGQTTYDESNYSFNISCPPDFPPTIEAWEPGGIIGQTYTQGDIIAVKWNASDDNPLPSNPINITYGNSTIGWTTIAISELNDGTYDWNTSTAPCPGTYWVNLSVYDSIGQSTFDEGNYSFNLNCPPDDPPVIEVWEPGGTSGQFYIQGEIVTVTWNTSDDNPLPANPINITYGSGALWTTITTDQVDDGTYSWDTSTVPCPGTYWMNLSVYDSIGQTTFDESNYSFDLLCPVLITTIEAYEPGGTQDQTYTQGDSIVVTWNASSTSPLPPNPINITYGNSTSGWTTIATYEENDGIYNWDTSAVPCPGTYWINISVFDSMSQTAIDESNYSFELLCPDNPPSIEVWEPGGVVGQSYIKGDPIIVTWTANDDNPLPANPINITYGIGAPLWTVISTDEINDGTYTWDTSTVPCALTYWMNLSVYDSIGQTTFDKSNYSFTVLCPDTTGNITGTVEDENGNPIQGATVTLRNSTNVVVDTTTTNSNGNFTFTDVEEGLAEYNITVEKSGYDDVTVTDVNVTAGSTTNIGTIVMSETAMPPDKATLTGRVIDENGDPIEGASLKLIATNGTIFASVLTNSSGKYQFDNVSFGNYTIKVSASDYADATLSKFTVTADRILPDIVMETAWQPPEEEDFLANWWWIIVLIVVIIIVLMILVFLLKRRKKLEKVSEMEEPDKENPSEELKT